MASATIGDDVTPLYKFDWDDAPSRTSDELGDFDEAGIDLTIEDIIDVARDDPDCEVTVIGFEES
jgi:hypothetical protein